MSFRLQTILGIALIEGVLLLLLVWSGMNYLTSSNHEALEQQAQSTAALFVSLMKDAVLTYDLATLEEGVDEVIASPGIVYVRVSAHGATLVERGEATVLARPFVEDTRLANVTDAMFDVRRTIMVEGGELGVVEMGFSTTKIDSLISAAQQRFFILVAVEMVLVALFSYVLGTYLTRVLSRLTRAAREITQGELGTQVEVSGHDELADMGQAFNKMSLQLLQSNREMVENMAQAQQLAEQLQHSELRTRTILNTAVDGFVIIDDGGLIQEINRAGANTFGYQPSQLIGRNVSVLMPEPHRGHHDGYISHYLHGGKPQVIGSGREVAGLRRDGSTFPMDLSVSEMQLGDERMFVGLVRDITQRKAAESALQRNEKLMTAIVDANLDALITIDSGGEIIEFSPVAAEMFGYSEQEALGQRLSQLIIPPEYRRAHEEGMAHYLKTGKAKVLGKRIEITAMRNGGECFPIELAISPIAIDDSQLFTAFIRDISQRKAAEQQLEEAKRSAEAASQAKSRFLAHMSHEIRSPLNAVLGSLDLLKQSPLDHEQHRYAHTAETSGRALLGVISDVLDFSKIEAGELSLDHLKFSLREMVVSVGEVIAYRASGKPVDIASTLGHGIPTTLLGDPSRIRQVLINLMDNAVKFTERGAVVLTVSAKSSTRDSVNVRFCVEDTGSGIPESEQTRLFDEFSQMDNTDSTRFGGTGLGLAICKQLVELMGGNIGVDSRVGRGSRFWFEIPLAHSGDRIEECVPEHLAMRVLVVGLSRLARAAVGYQYELLGCEVDLAARGREALNMVAQGRGQPYDYILIDEAVEDVELPLLLQRLRAKSDARMVLIPREGDTQGRTAGQMGFEQLLMRPFHIDGLLAVLHGEPLRETQVVEANTVETAAGDTRGRILLAEDSKANQMVATLTLERAGHQVVVANDGQEAVAAFRQGGIDLILMDLRMPNMTGIEATEAIRQLETGHRVPILAMTANALQEDLDRCLAAGMNDYVTKPFATEDLLAVVGKWLEGGESSESGEESSSAAVEGDEAAQEPLVNPQAFAHLAHDTSLEMLPTMVEMFLSESRERVTAIKGETTELTMAQLCDQAHTLKSLAGTFGAPRLQQVAKALEDAARGEAAAEAGRLGEQLVTLYEQTLQAYQQSYDSYMEQNGEHSSE